MNKRKRFAAGLMILSFIFILLSGLVVNGLHSETGSDGMKDFGDPVIIEFPLRGEWMTPTTPATKIPSHGTDQLGERYAFDFMQVDWERNSKPFYRTNFLQYLFLGVPLNECYGWGQEVYAPCVDSQINFPLSA